jgi:hypothetical protein
MLKNGTYVRFVIAPNTRMGTVSQGTIDGGKERYIFRHDKRFLDTTGDHLYVFDYDIEVCPRPSDADVQAINVLIKKGS